MKSKIIKITSLIILIAVLSSIMFTASAEYSTPQEVTTSVISLPQDTIEGKMDLVVKGNTVTNLVKSSNMNTDTDDNGIVDGWADGGTSTSVTAVREFDTNLKAQKIEILDSTASGESHVRTALIPVNEGDVISFYVESKVQINNGNCRLRIQVQKWRCQYS